VRVGTWLVLRELCARGWRAVMAAALVAAAAALGTGLELVARGREEAANERIDGVGPALRLVPNGVGGSELMRLDLGNQLLPPGTAKRVTAALGPDLREARERLVLQIDISGRRVPVVGVGHGKPGGVELGSALAEAFGHPATLDVGRGPEPVLTVRDATGSSEDGAVFLPLLAAKALAGKDGINEIQVFLRSGVPPETASARLAAADLHAKLVPGGRGAPADQEVQGALAHGRRLAQGVLALLLGLGLAVTAHLDAAERRSEVATLRAVGADAVTVWWTIVSRSTLVGLAGGAVGALAGVALAAAQDPSVAPGLVADWPVAFTVAGLCALLGALAAGPTAIAMALRNPVPWLQES
jgi:putative ABC transport system permease protein